MKKPYALRRFLHRNKHRLSSLLILTHDFPDPDALASASALQHLAGRGFGIRSRIVYGGIIGRTENREMIRILNLPVHRLRSSDFKRYPHVALVDTQPAFGNNSFPDGRKAAIVIDQHFSSTKPLAEFSFIDPTSGATSVILAQALLSQGLEIPERVATALVYGIISDTMHLSRVEREEVIETYLTLLPLCNMRSLARIQNPPRSPSFFPILARAVNNAILCRRLIVSHIGFVESPDVVSQIADLLLTNEATNTSFCTGRHGSQLHLSLRVASPRSRAGTVLRDVVAQHGQAGGHGRIAGGQVAVGSNRSERTWRAKERILTDRLKARLRIPTHGRFRPAFGQSSHPRRKNS
jgi:nanoRNase/pAp phosphatase (c-di-AMP/oligoRNAs hydrolase)